LPTFESPEIRTSYERGNLGFSRLLKEPGLQGIEPKQLHKIIESAGERMPQYNLMTL